MNNKNTFVPIIIIIMIIITYLVVIITGIQWTFQRVSFHVFYNCSHFRDTNFPIENWKENQGSFFNSLAPGLFEYNFR